MVSLYKANNKHRTYEAAIAKEKAHKRKLKEQEDSAWSVTQILFIQSINLNLSIIKEKYQQSRRLKFNNSYDFEEGRPLYFLDLVHF